MSKNISSNNSEKKRVLLGMSGGVDSSVAAVLLQNQGYEVIGVTMTLWKPDNDASGCGTSAAVLDAKQICDKLGIEHYEVDYTKEFKKHVIDDFICTYNACRTPNPCIECNKYMKFGLMFDKAKELGADYIATGHYAKTEYSKKYKRYALKVSDSISKDQSYVLYNIPKDKVEHVLFPLGIFKDKSEIRQIAEENNLIVAKKPDSQDICFIPDNDYKGFLNRNGVTMPEGDIVHVNGEVLGEHKGLYSYTIGQRKGLNIAYKSPLYVIRLDKEKNQVIVGSMSDLIVHKISVSNVNLILLDEKDLLDKSIEVKAKTRYSSKLVSTSLTMIDNEVILTFNEDATKITPGQSVVFYDEDGYVLGGGKINNIY